MSTMRHRATSPTDGEKVKEQLVREADEKELTEGQKFILPNFTVKQLLDAIPAHCFQRSALRSSLYILQDAGVIAACVYGIYHVDSFLAQFNLGTASYWAAKAALWTAYHIVTGLFGTGLWGFSPSKRINNSVGWVVASFLLVPYHSWRISHGRHHAACNHLTRDEVFVPRTRKELGYPEIKEEGEAQGINISAVRQAELREALEDSPLATLWNLYLHQIFGWPLYLIRNASGQLHYPKGTNHFSPSSIIFKDSQFWQIVWSDIGVTLGLLSLGAWVYFRGPLEVASVYLIPYLWVNHWLVLITFLQHTDPILPHYSANKWTFARGALATIDRKIMGPIGPYVLHGIAETHVVHHVSSKIPHYNAWEATNALKEFVGPHYYSTEENIFLSFYRCYRECLFVEDGQDVVFYKNASGLAKRVPIEEGGQFSDSGIDMSEFK